MVSAAVVLLSMSPRAHAQKEDLADCDKYFERNDLKRAAAACDKAIKKWPKQVPPEAYGKRAAMFIVEKQYQPGLQFIRQKAKVVYPDAPDVLEQEALMLWALGDKRRAAMTAQKVVVDKPGSFTNQDILGQWYWQTGQTRQVAGAYEAYFKHRPESVSKNDVLPLVKLGFSYLSVGRLVDAEKSFTKLLRDHKGRPHADVNANNGLCAAYTAMGKFDRAITTCETITSNPKKIDRAGSVWYNLGRAYLSKKQATRAIDAGQQYTRLRKNEPKGFILIGDAYFQQQDWEKALRFYETAEKKAQGRADIIADLSVKLGTVHSRTGDYLKAIKKLENAVQVQPNNATLITELGSAYINNGDDDKALTTADKALAMQPKDVQLLIISGRALYNKGNHKDARARYEQAFAINPTEAKIKIGLVQTINFQAGASLKAGRVQDAEKMLSLALNYDRRSSLTNRNLAILSIMNNQCDKALGYLKPLARNRGSALIYHRLSGRAHTCKSQPDLAAASKSYASAEKIAKGSNNLMLAEVYTEWAPILLRDPKNIGDATEMLETAVRYARTDQNIGSAAVRNLALALYRRGWTNMRSGKSEAAVADFDRAARDPRVLKGTEPMAFQFSLALAYLERGETQSALKMLRTLASKGQQSKYLKAPYDKVGNQFFSAYAKYRTANANSHQAAARDFGRLLSAARGPFKNKVQDLLASSWEQVAYDSYRSGGSANTALANAAKYASNAATKRNVAHNKAVLGMGKGGNAAAFKDMAGNPPEALVNLGIVEDRSGKPKEAYDAWVKAKAKGARSKNLDKWIAAKRRFFGFGN